MKTVFLYSHTHWDREWYLSQTQFQYRLVRTVDEIIAFLDDESAFNVFVLDGQTCILQDYLELRPERLADIRRLTSTGKIVIGPWYSMPDLFLPGGEALIRNLVRGYADCRRYGAAFPAVGYVPDSFGHIEQMPQILRGVGIDNYIFSRGRPVALSVQDGHKQEFLWRSPDGSTVLALDLPGNYCAARYLPGADDSDALRDRIHAILALHAHSHRPDRALAAHGIDHTWLQRDIGEILRVLPECVPEVHVHHGTIEDAIRAWRADMPEDLETWEGPLRGRLGVKELHGTLSSRMDNKIANAQARMVVENLAEPLNAMAVRFGGAAADCHLRKAWERIFQNHAHDSICGCSQDRVHDEVNIRFRQASEIGTDVADSALDLFNQDARRLDRPGVVVYAGLNGGHRLVDFVLRLPYRPSARLCLIDDVDGTPRPVQMESVLPLRIVHTNAEVHCYEVRGCLHLPVLAPGEVRRFRVARGDAPRPSEPVRCSGNVLENGRLRVEVRKDGSLDLSDPRSGHTVAGTHYFVQEADCGGGYHFEPLADDQRRDSRDGRVRIRRRSGGPLRGRLEVTLWMTVPRRYDRRKLRRTGKAVITVTSILTLDADSDRLRICTTIDNTACHQRLRLVVSTGKDGAAVHADSSFAVHANQPGQWPAEPRQNSHPMRSFVDVGDASGGLVFLGSGQHEYEMVDLPSGRAVEVTLLRSVDFVFLCSTWETPGAQLLGRLTHDYALQLHDGDWRQGAVAEASASFLNPPVANTHGDSLHPAEREGHATLGFYVREKGVEIPVDTNRSPWHATLSHRDGWRRMEADRFLSCEIPPSIVPFRMDGLHLVVSAFKRAEDGKGEILRFWSAAETPQTVTVSCDLPAATIRRVDLLERPVDGDFADAGLPVSIPVRPFEIVSLRITQPS